MTVRTKAGFTLIELSMVLLIIALLIAGIVVGKSMLQAAKVRAAANRYTELEAALKTFRLKYNLLPGDMTRTRALGFGFTAITTTGAGYGDENGLITAPPGSDYQPLGEVLLIWLHLSQAKLIENKSATLASDGWVSTAVSGDAVATLLLRSQYEKGSYYFVYGINGMNYVHLAGVTDVNRPGVGYYRTYNNLDPVSAWMIDGKLDDGLPRSGQVQAYTFTGGITPSTLAAASSGSGACVATDNLNYNMLGTDAKLLTCQLQFRTPMY